LKENVIVGRLVPAGTGFREFSRLRLTTEEPTPPTPEENQEAV
jgi:hypothetical protein